MDTTTVVVVAVLAAAVLLLVGLTLTFVQRRKRDTALRDRFGPEYERTLEQADNRRQARSELTEREQQREQLQIRPLPAAARERFAARWHDTQAEFVDAPSDAVREAQRLVTQVMRERGYPVDDFETQASVVSVDHPHVVENYREAHRIARADQSGQAGTEDLRQAMQCYRALFDELLVDDGGADTVDLRERPAQPTEVTDDRRSLRGRR